MRNSWGGRRQRKYGNTKIKYEGLTFDSETEFNRYLLLQDRQRDGEICDLKLKPAFWLTVNGVRIFERPFHPDFAYRLANCPQQQHFNDLQPGQPFPHCPNCSIVEDTKGYMDPGDAATKIFKIQCQLMRALYGIEVKVVQTVLAVRRQEARKKNQKEKRRLQKLALKQVHDRQQRRLI